MVFVEMMTRRQMMTAALAVVVICYLTQQAQAQWPLDPCKSVNCQKGQCVANATAFLGFECKCDKGWAKIAPSITFLGCFLPDCKLNFSCDGSQAAAPPPPGPAIASIPSTDPNGLCLLPGLCGKGDCEINQPAGILQLPSYFCHCHPGNFNMFNQSTGPCLPSCSLGGSCRDLDIPIITGQPPPAGNSPDTIAPPPDANEGLAPSPFPSLDEGEVETRRSSLLIGAALFLSALCVWW